MRSRTCCAHKRRVCLLYEALPSRSCKLRPPRKQKLAFACVAEGVGAESCDSVSIKACKALMHHWLLCVCFVSASLPRAVCLCVLESACCVSALCLHPFPSCGVVLSAFSHGYAAVVPMACETCCWYSDCAVVLLFSARMWVRTSHLATAQLGLKCVVYCTSTAAPVLLLHCMHAPRRCAQHPPSA